MSIRLPRMYGAIVRKSERSMPMIDAMWNQYREPQHMRNEDQHLAGFELAMDYRNLESFCSRWETSGLRLGVDYVLTCSEDGVLSAVPDWLLEEEGELFSIPGTGGPPRSTPRLTFEEQEAKREADYQARMDKDFREMVEVTSEVSARRWPGVAMTSPVEIDIRLLADFLGECWALVAFVEGCRIGGAARTWVEKTFPTKRWHISVANGYTNELQERLKEFYTLRDPLTFNRCTESEQAQWAKALTAVMRRAAEYVAGLEKGRSAGTVDLECFDAWRARAAST
ncbi:hypothetical protein [Rhizobacter fulvus]